MQFVSNGPDIPDSLLQAHEEGRVIFFCGAGISNPAGLPGFEDLVRDIYKETSTDLAGIEEELFKSKQYDAVLNRLENRHPGKRLRIRKALAKILAADDWPEDATLTHTALLKLAKSRDGSLRLVTTNFDSLFKCASERSELTFPTYSAPMLPVPKMSRWDGLVYLHGELTDAQTESELNRLVITSSDFGQAYLTERWAARFASELFRNFVVCFVGYSINDPIIRYMMDALAADRTLGEENRQAWAFGSFIRGHEKYGEEAQKKEWSYKGVTPILYEAYPLDDKKQDHTLLHKTLQEWGNTYHDGIMGKESIIVSHALSRPAGSTRQDNFVGRMLWALSDETGKPARKFAALNPVPELDWLLDAFEKNDFSHADLTRFGIKATEDNDPHLRFSLISRPALPYRAQPGQVSPYTPSHTMHLYGSGVNVCAWDKVMTEIARWLMRHLDDVRLILSIARHGGQLHPQFTWHLERTLKTYADLEAADPDKVRDIKKNAPNAVPGPLMKILWGMVLAGRLATTHMTGNFHSWLKRFRVQGLSTALRLELRDILSPGISLSPALLISTGADDLQKELPSTMRHLVNWELVLRDSGATHTLKGLRDEQWKAALSLLMDDFLLLIEDALAISQEMDGSDEYKDHSMWIMPSISEHAQNERSRSWAILIVFARDAWQRILEECPERAKLIAKTWFLKKYPLYKRLSFHAASQPQCISPDTWVGWLLSDNARWLWSSDTKREVCRLLVLQGMQLAAADQEILECAILAGPPREYFSSSLKDEIWDSIHTHEIWLHLAKLKSSGLKLGEAAEQKLSEISQNHPTWKLAENQSDEFSYWIGVGTDADFVDPREMHIAPSDPAELIDWIKITEPKATMYNINSWKELSEFHPDESLQALKSIALEGHWPQTFWKVALPAWCKEEHQARIWPAALPVILLMPGEVLLETVHYVSSWLERCSEQSALQDGDFLELSKRIIDLPLEPKTGITTNGKETNPPVFDAINHPVGHVTQALLDAWFRSKPQDQDGLPEQLKSIFTQFCDTNVEKFTHARVLLGTHLIALFRVDVEWTSQYLLPLFNWACAEARKVWEGFLWSPRMYLPLLNHFKTDFLETAAHYNALDEHKSQYVSLLVLVAVDNIDGIDRAEIRQAVSALPPEGLENVLLSLRRFNDGAEETRDQYWQNRVIPFWRDIWPKSVELVAPRISDLLVELILDAGNEFPDALDMVNDWLMPSENVYYLISKFAESGICRNYPEKALQLLVKIINHPHFAHAELKKCLEEIGAVMPDIERHANFIKLSEYLED